MSLTRLPYLIARNTELYEMLYARFGNINVVQIILDTLPDETVEFFHVRVIREMSHPDHILVYVEDISLPVEGQIYNWSFWTRDEVMNAVSRSFDIEPVQLLRMMVYIQRSQLFIFAHDSLIMDGFQMFVDF